MCFNTIKDIIHNATGPNSSWLWSMLQFIVIFFSLIFIWWQVRIQRFSNMLNIINSLYERWHSNDILSARKEVCSNYKKSILKINQRDELVLHFFEEIGIYLKKRIINLSIIWEFYSYYIEYYWPILKPKITNMREEKKDKTWYENFEYLFNKICRYSKRKKLKVTTKTKDEIEGFISSELEFL